MARRRKNDDDERLEVSSGNVFADLGLKNAEELLVRADLMIAITHEIRKRKLTQKQASQLIGLTQSDISSIARHKIDRFSQERLVEALRRLGFDVKITIKPSKNGYGAITVHSTGSLTASPR